jgi:DNA (cytosine-5)-methyltransferase 1
MKYLSLCSGIEAATVAWHPLGWEAVAYSEIERFPSEVLAHHYPSTPNLGDMTKFKEWNFESDVDLLVGGTPCQSFSVAGLRKGLDDPRGNLMLTYLAIADKYKPKWIVWENVPGVLSSNGGKDFGVFLGALGELGYGFAYRILDAQYFGVAQRRRRVFVVGYLGDWRLAAAVLFERHSLSGNPAPSREKRQAVAGTIASRFGISRNNHEECVTWPAEISSTLDTTFGTKQGLENQHVNAGCPMFVPAHTFSTPAIGHIVNDEISSTITKNTGAGGETQNPAYVVQPAYGIPGNWIGRKPENGGNATEPMHDIAPCLTKTDQHGVAAPIAFSGCDDGMDSQINVTPTMRIAGNAQGNLAVAVGTDLYNGAITGDVAATMSTAGSTSSKTGPTVMQAVGAFKPGQSAQAHSIGYESEMAPTLEAGSGGNNKPAVHVGMAVRRLTPVECERLQGFPDSYTDIKSKNKPTPDGPRYKALGNSMAVPVMAWIGQRIEQVEAICKQNK